MHYALEAAAAAGQAGDIPVGAIIVDNTDRILAISGNRREQDNDPTAHAEIVVLRQAGAALQTWQLSHCRLYVTLEPCPMCASAISQARIHQVIYGADDPKAGSFGSVLNLPAMAGFFHQPDTIAGVSRELCVNILKDWFAEHRQQKTSFD